MDLEQQADHIGAGLLGALGPKKFKFFIYLVGLFFKPVKIIVFCIDPSFMYFVINSNFQFSATSILKEGKSYHLNFWALFSLENTLLETLLLSLKLCTIFHKTMAPYNLFY